jgi:hypothetical protein
MIITIIRATVHVRDRRRCITKQRAKRWAGNYSDAPEKCTLLWHVSECKSRCKPSSCPSESAARVSNIRVLTNSLLYLQMPNNGASTARTTLPALALNITAHYISTSGLFGIDYYHEVANSVYAFNNKTYDLPWIEANGTCQPRATHRWGFHSCCSSSLCYLQRFGLLGCTLCG